MNSRVAGMAGVVIAMLIACSGPASAGTSTITFSQKGLVTVSKVFFNAAVSSPAALYTFTGIDSTGHSFSGQMLFNGLENRSATCTFTGPGGVTESGHVENLVGGAGITIIPGVGRLYSVAVPATGAGCSNHSAVSLTENETIEGGAGIYKGATGTRTLQLIGQPNGDTAFLKVTGSATITVP